MYSISPMDFICINCCREEIIPLSIEWTILCGVSREPHLPSDDGWKIRLRNEGGTNSFEAAKHSCREAEIDTRFVSGGRSTRFYQICSTKFIAWCQRRLIRGMPTRPRIFASAQQGFSPVRGSHYKTTSYQILTWWNVG